MIVDEYLEMLDRVNMRHREFVSHLETVHKKIDDKFEEMEHKITYCQR